MSIRSKERLPDERLEALGRLERRRLLLKLSTIRGDPCLDFGLSERTAGELDPYVMMRHLHLPVLDELGFVRWDQETDEVTKGPRFDELEPFLQPLREVRDDLPGRCV